MEYKLLTAAVGHESMMFLFGLFFSWAPFDLIPLVWLNPLAPHFPLWGQTSQILGTSSLKRDCGSKRVQFRLNVCGPLSFIWNKEYLSSEYTPDKTRGYADFTILSCSRCHLHDVPQAQCIHLRFYIVYDDRHDGLYSAHPRQKRSS